MNHLPVRWRLLLMAVLAILFAGIAAFTLQDYIDDRAVTLKASRLNQTLTAKVAAQVLAMTVDGLTGPVNNAAKSIQGSDRRVFQGPNEAESALEAARDSLTSSKFKSARLVDAWGRTLAVWGDGSGAEVRVDDTHPMLAFHQANPSDTGVHVGFPRTTEPDEDWVLPMSRGIFDSHGRLEGVLTVNVALTRVHSLYAQISDARGPLSLSLVGPEHAQLTWSPNGETSGPAVLTPKFPRELLSGDGGTFDYRAEDGAVQRYAFSAVGSAPMYVLVGVSENQVLAGWRQSMAMEVSIALFCSAVVVLLALAVLRSMFRIQSLNSRIAVQNRVLHATMRNVKDDLRDATDELDALTSVVPQHIKSPAQQARGYLAMAIRDAEHGASAPLKSILRRADRHVSDLEHAIFRVINLTQVSREMLLQELCDVSTMAHQAADQLRRKHPKHNVTLRVQPGMMATADRRQLQLVLDNLIGNAWKFTVDSPAPKVSIGMLCVDGVEAFYVKDNGIGIDARKAEALFRPFEPLNDRPELTGAGMGLATVHRITRRHGGSVWAQKNSGPGSTFWFTLRPHPGAKESDKAPVVGASA